jgi:hypothetical protein
MLAGLRGIQHTPGEGRGVLLYSGIDAKLDEDHLKILNAPGSDEVSGVTCTLCHVLTSRPVEWARQEAQRWRL